ncbi:hypothetical protein NGM10_06590 [Halorussus salilacus]|uniref:hypothetical protein n=1 Tax=Halorussus salilacus TaxID=2953750 RepID=UPI00209C92A4|nr:hypothetical protein [Halorussus salilacus]USZ69397.1 hypothetical protein NGM10_06590 [Halorussus salilacus]
MTDASEGFDYPRAAVAGDLAVVAAVAVVLVAVHVLLPEATHDRLAFDHGAFAPETLLTAAYVHAGNDHLLNNVGGYLSLAVVTYLVCLNTGRRAWFRRTLPVFLLALPVAVNLTSYVLLESRYPGSTPISRGFSGVVAGFGGFLLAAVAVQLRANYSRATAFFVGGFAVLLLLAELLWIYRDGTDPVEVAAVSAGLALAVSGIVTRGLGAKLGGDHYRRVGFDLVYVSLVLALLVWLVYGLFPASPVAGGTFTNVFAHAAGFVEGGLLAALTLVAVRP